MDQLQNEATAAATTNHAEKTLEALIGLGIQEMEHDSQESVEHIGELLQHGMKHGFRMDGYECIACGRPSEYEVHFDESSQINPVLVCSDQCQQDFQTCVEQNRVAIKQRIDNSKGDDNDTSDHRDVLLRENNLPHISQSIYDSRCGYLTPRECRLYFRLLAALRDLYSGGLSIRGWNLLLELDYRRRGGAYYPPPQICPVQDGGEYPVAPPIPPRVVPGGGTTVVPVPVPIPYPGGRRRPWPRPRPRPRPRPVPPVVVPRPRPRPPFGRFPRPFPRPRPRPRPIPRPTPGPVVVTPTPRPRPIPIPRTPTPVPRPPPRRPVTPSLNIPLPIPTITGGGGRSPSPRRSTGTSGPFSIPLTSRPTRLAATGGLRLTPSNIGAPIGKDEKVECECCYGNYGDLVSHIAASVELDPELKAQLIGHVYDVDEDQKYSSGMYSEDYDEEDDDEADDAYASSYIGKKYGKGKGRKKWRY